MAMFHEAGISTPSPQLPQSAVTAIWAWSGVFIVGIQVAHVEREIKVPRPVLPQHVAARDVALFARLTELVVERSDFVHRADVATLLLTYIMAHSGCDFPESIAAVLVVPAPRSPRAVHKDAPLDTEVGRERCPAQEVGVYRECIVVRCAARPRQALCGEMRLAQSATGNQFRFYAVAACPRQGFRAAVTVHLHRAGSQRGVVEQAEEGVQCRLVALAVEHIAVGHETEKHRHIFVALRLRLY